MSPVERLALLERSLSQTDARIDTMLESRSTPARDLDLEYDYRATLQTFIDEIKRKQNKKRNILVRLFRK